MNIKLSTLFISIIGAIVFITTTNATTMCVTDDMEQVILDPSVPGESYTSQPSSKTWITTFPYGTVSGIATCNSTSGTYARTYLGYDFDNNYASSEGVYCWCRMTSPVRSAWVFPGMSYSASNCAQYCADACGTYLQTDSYFRMVVFRSAGM